MAGTWFLVGLTNVDVKRMTPPSANLRKGRIRQETNAELTAD